MQDFTIGLNSKVQRNIELLTDCVAESCDDAEIVLVSFGVTARASLRAVRTLRERGVKAGWFRPRVVWPFPEKPLRELAGRAHTFIVPELNLGQLRLEVERSVGADKRIVGINQVDGHMLELRTILSAVEEVLG